METVCPQESNDGVAISLDGRDHETIFRSVVIMRKYVACKLLLNPRTDDFCRVGMGRRCTQVDWKPL